MRWAAKQRMGFIKDAVARGDTVSRIHLVNAFGVSEQTASADIANYRSLFPGTLEYDKSLKVYKPATTHIEDEVSNG